MLPQDPSIRRFYLVAVQRWGDAEVLFSAGRYRGSIYLAGYTIECVLKALICDATPVSRRPIVSESFRGQHGHNLDWLRASYLTMGSTSIPRTVQDALFRVQSWETTLRYQPGIGSSAEAKAFLEATLVVLEWAKSKL